MSFLKKVKEKITSPEFKEKLRKTGMELSKTAKGISKGAGKLSKKSSGYWESQLKGKKGRNSFF